jgi:hypothetical protein
MTMVMRPLLFVLTYSLPIFSAYASPVAIPIGAPIGPCGNLTFTITEGDRPATDPERGVLNLKAADLFGCTLQTGSGVEIAEPAGADRSGISDLFSVQIAPRDSGFVFSLSVTSDKIEIPTPGDKETYVAKNPNTGTTATYNIVSGAEIPEPSPRIFAFGVVTVVLLGAIWRGRKRSALAPR